MDVPVAVHIMFFNYHALLDVFCIRAEVLSHNLSTFLFYFIIIIFLYNRLKLTQHNRHFALIFGIFNFGHITYLKRRKTNCKVKFTSYIFLCFTMRYIILL